MPELITNTFDMEEVATLLVALLDKKEIKTIKIQQLDTLHNKEKTLTCKLKELPKIMLGIYSGDEVFIIEIKEIDFILRYDGSVAEAIVIDYSKAMQKDMTEFKAYFKKCIKEA